jgi:uncharacterized protein YfdQ (DUF2303 family)
MKTSTDPMTTPPAFTPEASVVREITEASMSPAPITIALPHGTLPTIAVSERVALHSLAHLLPRPLRSSGTTHLLTLQDLHAFLAKHADKKEETVIYANRKDLSFSAILNHNSRGTGPGWGDYRAKVTLTKSRQLTVWQAQNGQSKKMSQEAFALFLEEHIEDIRDPAGADVLTFAETLEATRTEVFKSSIVTATGEQRIAYSSERQGEQSSQLITKITLGIPLFEGGEPYAVEVKISHRVTDGKLTFWFDLRHIDYLLDAAWKEQVTFLMQTVSEMAHIFNGLAPDSQRIDTLDEGGSV